MKQPITDKLAKQKNICLIPLFELYLELVKIQEGKLSIKEFCEQIYKCNNEYKSN